MTVAEIAARIDAHLIRFERDRKINRYTMKGMEGLKPYYHAGAWASGRYVRVVYIRYQGSTALPKAEAEAYLARLDAGHVGSHYEARSKGKRR